MPISSTDVNVVNTPDVNVTGTVTVSGSVTTGGLTDAQLRATPVPVTSTAQTSSSATVTSVVLVGNTSATLLAANPNRLGASVFIASQPAYIKFGTTASSTSFTYKVVTNNTTVEFPSRWVGRIDILSQNGQTVTVTEY